MQLYFEIQNCFPTILAHLGNNALEQFLRGPCGMLRCRYSELRLWVCNTLLAENYSLLHLFQANGFTQKDEMASLVLTLLHYSLQNGSPLML